MITTQFFIRAYDSFTMKVIYIRLEDEFIILLANLDVRLGIFISIYIYTNYTPRAFLGVVGIITGG
jgi:hypothetical protein